MSSFQLQADMYNSITPGEVEAKKLEERVKKLEKEIKPQGKWIFDYLGYLICSNCGYECLYNEEGCYSLGYYCHHCGAKMREADND